LTKIRTATFNCRLADGNPAQRFPPHTGRRFLEKLYFQIYNQFLFSSDSK